MPATATAMLPRVKAAAATRVRFKTSTATRVRFKTPAATRVGVKTPAATRVRVSATPGSGVRGEGRGRLRECGLGGVGVLLRVKGAARVLVLVGVILGVAGRGVGGRGHALWW